MAPSRVPPLPWKIDNDGDPLTVGNNVLSKVVVLWLLHVHHDTHIPALMHIIHTQ